MLKIILYVLLVILSGALFLPTTGGIRNLPILITCVALFVLFWLVRYIRTWHFTCTTTRLLKKKGVRIKRVILFFKTAYIIAECGDCIWSIRLYRGINQKYRYHFEKENVLEVYKTTRETYSGPKRNVDGAHGPPVRMSDKVYKGAATEKLVKRKKLLNLKVESDKDIRHIILMSTFPLFITDFDSDLKRDPIGEGDIVSDRGAQVWSIGGMREHLDAM